MKVTEIIINEQPYQLFFGGAALSNLFKEFEADGLVDLVAKSGVDKDSQKANLSNLIDKSCKIAFAGIENYCVVNKLKNNFENVEQLKANVTNLSEIMPAMTAYTEAMANFFRPVSEENSEGEDKGATVTAPN